MLFGRDPVQVDHHRNAAFDKTVRRNSQSSICRPNISIIFVCLIDIKSDRRYHAELLQFLDLIRPRQQHVIEVIRCFLTSSIVRPPNFIPSSTASMSRSSVSSAAP